MTNQFLIQNILSEELKEELGIRTLGEDEVVLFRHVRANVVDPSSVNEEGIKKLVTPAYHSFPGKQMIRDKYGKEAGEKEIMNIEGFRTIPDPSGRPTVAREPMIVPIRFPDTGELYMTSGKENMLHFLLANDKNASKPNRKPGVSPVYREINEKKELTLKQHIFEYMSMAANMIMEADDDADELVKLADAISKAHPNIFKYNPNDIASVKAGLSNFAQMYALQFLTGVKEPRSYAKVIADDAILRRVIFFDDNSESLTWHFKRPDGKAKAPILTKLDSKKGHVKKLAEYLSSPAGSAHFAELKGNFEKYYQVSR